MFICDSRSKVLYSNFSPGVSKQGATSCPVAVVQLRLRIRRTEKKSAQVHCCREIEALVFLLADLMIVRRGLFFNEEKRRHASKCVIRPIWEQPS